MKAGTRQSTNEKPLSNGGSGDQARKRVYQGEETTMKKWKTLGVSAAAAVVMASASATPSVAAECDVITLGSAISLTGKYATNGVHAKNGYEFAIQKIKENGGIKVDDKCYNFNVIYYDDESKGCLLYTSPSPRDRTRSRMPSSA